MNSRWPPMSSMRSAASVMSCGMSAHPRGSTRFPVGPPSALAPLSDSTISRVLSSTPRVRKKATIRPIWASAWVRNPANRLN